MRMTGRGESAGAETGAARAAASGSARADLGPVPPIRLFVLGVLAALRALGLVLVADAIARGIAGAASGSLDARTLIALGIAGGLLRAVAGWATQVAARRIASGVKTDLRARLWRRIADGGTGRHGGVSALAGEGLDDLDDYYAQSLPAMIAAVAVPAIVGLRILGADWVSALIVVLTVPLVPVFMILIGKHTQAATDEATGALTRLADHLTELARGLPVLVGLGRVEDQTAALRGIQREYRTRTMATLRTAFLSALALELIATLSVAIVAVFLGLRLMNGSVTLEAALVALILAPEIYGALRDVGTAFHASQAGVAALTRVKALLGRPAAPDVRRPTGAALGEAAAPAVVADGDGAGTPLPDAAPGTSTRDRRGGTGSANVVSVTDLTIQYSGRRRPIVDGLTTELSGITALTGPSGCGKSTVLAALAGVLPGDATVSGTIRLGDAPNPNAVNPPSAGAGNPDIPGGGTPAGEELTAYGTAAVAEGTSGAGAGQGTAELGAHGHPTPGPSPSPSPGPNAVNPPPTGAGNPDFPGAGIPTGEELTAYGTAAPGGGWGDAPFAAWAPQAPHGFAATPRDELLLYGAADADAALAELGLTHVATSDVAEISPGELRRLAVARALVRADAGAALLVLDEPTAHLDADSAGLVRAAIARRARCTPVVIASHEPETVALAGRRIAIGRPVASDASESGRSSALAPADDGAEPLRVDAAAPLGDERSASSARTAESSRRPGARVTGRPDRAATAGRAENHGPPVANGTEAAETRAPVALLALIRPQRWRWLGAVLLGLIATGLGLSLTAVSGWLIVRASVEEHIMYLMVAIVGVRFFGLGRSVARYAERLATHSAAFRAIDGLRIRMWGAIAARGAGSRRLLEGGAPVDYLVTQADELRDQLPRVFPPIAVGVLAIVGVTITTWFVAPPLAAVVGLTLSAAGLLGAVLAVTAERGAGAAGVAERAEIVRGTASLAAAADDLRGNSSAGRSGDGDRAEAAGVPADPRGAALARLDETASRLARAERRAARGAGLGSAVAALATSLLAAVIPPLAFAEGIGAEQISVIALLCLAAFEPVGAIVQAVQRAPAQSAAIGRIAPILEPVPPALTGTAHIAPPVRILELDDLAAAYPAYARAAGRSVFRGVSAEVARGEWLVVDGPSGSGKTTLLSILMGSLRPAHGEVRANGTPLPIASPDRWRERVTWCPQEAHVFDSTLRGNLLLARGAADAPTDEEMIAVLRRAGLGVLLDALPAGLDARVGPAGAALSGGERQRLAVARALLSRADVLLLDEPTAHLDAPTAAAMMADIRAASADRVTVLVSHRADDHGVGDRRVSLTAVSALTAAA